MVSFCSSLGFSRQTRQMRRKLFFLFAFVRVFSGQILAADTNEVLNSFLASQTKIKTWSADFVETRTSKSFVQPLTAEGHVWFSAPDRFHWELGQPPQTIAVRQPEQMLVIYPKMKR